MEQRTTDNHTSFALMCTNDQSHLLLFQRGTLSRRMVGEMLNVRFDAYSRLLIDGGP